MLRSVGHRLSAAAANAAAATTTTTTAASTCTGVHVRAMASVGGSKVLPMAENRDEIVRSTLSTLGLSDDLPGVWPPVNSHGGDAVRIPRLDPTTGKELVSIPDATEDQASAVIENALKAQAEWKVLSGDERLKIILKSVDALKAAKDPLATLLTLEVGKITSESNGELVEVFDVADMMVKRAAELGGSAPYVTRRYDLVDPKRRQLGWIGEERRVPLGLLGKITAFNFPYAVFGWGALPALGAGNGVVLKPHPAAALTSAAMVRIMDDVFTTEGFPGLVSLVLMSDKKATDRLWRDPRVNMWEVTGSVGMGLACVDAVNKDFRRTLLELGGNNAVIVDRTANVANAIESCTFGASGTAGQRCTTTRMVFVHEDVYSEFLDGFVAGYKRDLVIGDPLVAGVNVGPVHHKRQVDAFKKTVKMYKAAGSKLLAGGRVFDGPGSFVEPTIFEAPTTCYDAIKEERFVPVVHVVKYRQLDTVIDFINSTGYGLSGGVFTRDDAVFAKCVENIRVGILNRNYGSSGAEAGENFGGEGKTGNGRMLGPETFKLYTRYVNSVVAPADSEIVHAQGVQVKAKKTDAEPHEATM